MDVRVGFNHRLLRAMLLVFCGVLAFRFPAFGMVAVPPKKGDLQLTGAAFKDRDAIPARYTCDGKNVSPPLRWTGAPDKTKSFVLIVDDPDAPGGLWVHWLVYNLPGTVTGLAEGTVKSTSLPANARQGTNDF